MLVPRVVVVVTVGARERDADHGVPRDELPEALFGPALCAGGAGREDEESQVRGGVVDADGPPVGGQVEAE